MIRISLYRVNGPLFEKMFSSVSEFEFKNANDLTIIDYKDIINNCFKHNSYFIIISLFLDDICETTRTSIFINNTKELINSLTKVRCYEEDSIGHRLEEMMYNFLCILI